jgi:hypothetical protein
MKGADMNSTLRRLLIVAGLVFVAGLLLFAGTSVLARGTGPFSGMNMMGSGRQYQSGSGVMGGMMGSGGTMPHHPGMMNLTGTMGIMGMMPHQPGMMMGFGSSALLGAQPLSLDQATNAVNAYVNMLDSKDLAVGEVMIFDNHAYAQVIEESTGASAFEVLVNPLTLQVYPEPGPNMMWNAKYGHMGGAMGGMMAMMGLPVREATTTMPVSAANAVKAAQSYLDQNLPGAQAAQQADTFYGYYTMHILRASKVIGMLSVDGYSSQVFVHTWHGNFIEMSEGEHQGTGR